MPSLNKVMIIGNVGREPELRFTANGYPVCGFTVAVNTYSKTPEGEKKRETEWFAVTAWRKLAESCNQFITKGMPVFIEGRLKTRSWDDNGITRYKTEIIAQQVIFLSRTDVDMEADKATDSEDPFEPEDLPF